jgi:hypothetical protein
MKIKNGFVIEKVGTSYLAVAVGKRAAEFSNMVRLNSTGAFLWNCLSESELTREELLDKVLSTYDVAREAALADIIAFEKILSDNGILE